MICLTRSLGVGGVEYLVELADQSVAPWPTGNRSRRCAAAAASAAALRGARLRTPRGFRRRAASRRIGLVGSGVLFTARQQASQQERASSQTPRRNGESTGRVTALLHRLPRGRPGVARASRGNRAPRAAIAATTRLR